MENGFERIIEKLKEYEQNHRKLILLERKELIVKNYENLTFELENEAEFSLWEEENSIHITITADSLLTCDEAHSLNFLLGIANYSELKIVDNQIVIYLWFRCWEWIDR